MTDAVPPAAEDAVQSIESVSQPGTGKAEAEVALSQPIPLSEAELQNVAGGVYFYNPFSQGNSYSYGGGYSPYSYTYGNGYGTPYGYG